VIEPQDTLAASLLSRHSLVAGRYFIFVGRIVEEKGVHDLIRVYKELQTDMPLVIIGDDDAGTRYRDQVFANASRKIKFLGFIYNDEYEQLLLNAYMYLSASRLEGTSPSLLSAMGAGICCLVNGIAENVATIKGAFPAYAENDLGDLQQRWQHLIDNPDEAARYAQQGQECIRQNYSWDAVAADYLELLVE
jgi:glycosyltransferase involved in cell wall biosynthesis